MDLPTVWFILIAVLWTGYLVLEGFDAGRDAQFGHVADELQPVGVAI